MDDNKSRVHRNKNKINTEYHNQGESMNDIQELTIRILNHLSAEYVRHT